MTKEDVTSRGRDWNKSAKKQGSVKKMSARRFPSSDGSPSITSSFLSPFLLVIDIPNNTLLKFTELYERIGDSLPKEMKDFIESNRQFFIVKKPQRGRTRQESILSEPSTDAEVEIDMSENGNHISSSSTEPSSIYRE